MGCFASWWATRFAASRRGVTGRWCATTLLIGRYTTTFFKSSSSWHTCQSSLILEDCPANWSQASGSNQMWWNSRHVVYMTVVDTGDVMPLRHENNPTWNRRYFPKQRPIRPNHVHYIHEWAFTSVWVWLPCLANFYFEILQNVRGLLPELGYVPIRNIIIITCYFPNISSNFIISVGPQWDPCPSVVTLPSST